MNPDQLNPVCPTHSELAAEFRNFKELTKILFEEREKLSLARAITVDQRINALEKTTQGTFDAVQIATDKSEKAKHDHDLQANGLAETLKSQTQTFYQKTEAVTEFKHVSDRLEDQRKEYEAYKLSMASEIRSLRESRSSGEGRTSGVSATRDFVMALIGLVGGGSLVGVDFEDDAEVSL